MRIIHSAALLIGGLAAGVVITNMAHSEPAQPKSIPVIEVQAPDVAPATYLGESDPITPLACGVNLDCSQVDRQIASQVKPVKKSGNSRTVKSSKSSNGASSTTVTTKSPAGSSTVTKSRTAKGVTTTSRSTTVSK